MKSYEKALGKLWKSYGKAMESSLGTKVNQAKSIKLLNISVLNEGNQAKIKQTH